MLDKLGYPFKLHAAIGTTFIEDIHHNTYIFNDILMIPDSVFSDHGTD